MQPACDHARLCCFLKSLFCHAPAQRWATHPLTSVHASIRLCSCPDVHVLLNECMQVLGTGELTKALTIKAVAFSSSAKAKIEAAGGKAEEISGRVKWTRKAYEKAKKANPNFAEEVKKAKVAKLQAKGRGKKAASA
eukprot:364362-Chlamydomonas_euryale.AAC.8